MALKARHKETVAAYVFLIPNLLGFIIFTSIPVLASLGMSLFDAQIATWPQVLSGKFVGLGNFVKMLGLHLGDGVWAANDPKFWKYLGNTLFLMMVIPFSIFGSLILALIMNQKLRGIVVFRTIYFLPTISSAVAICLLWQWIYNPNFGLLNSIIAKLGNILHVSLRGPEWSSYAWAKPSLMIMGFWTVAGGHNVILYLAALQNIPKDFYDAASIDGASAWQKFWYVTWPMISPTTFFITIMAIIFGFQGGFLQAYIMYRGGPAGATTTLEYYIFKNFYEWGNVGYAATIAWFLFIIIFIITLINWRFGGRLVHY